MVSQDPKLGFDTDLPLELEEIERLTEVCVSRLVSDNGPLMETIRMQVGQLFLSVFQKPI